MHLDTLVNELSEEVELFREWWMLKHQKDPENFPMEFPGDNVGDWFHQFIAYYELGLNGAP